MVRGGGAESPAAASPSGLSVRSRLKSIKSILRRVPGASPVGRLLGKAVEFGTERYDEDTRRRLMILNVVAYLIAVATLVYAVQHVFMDYQVWRPVVLINSTLVVAALAVPLLHRINEIAGGVWLVVAEYVALFALTSYLGRESGVYVQYIIASAAPFLVFGLARIRLVLTIVAVGTVLHIVAWFSFDRPQIAARQDDIDAIYVSAALTTVALIAGTVWYAFRLVEKARGETERLLRSILPARIVSRLRAEPGAIIADDMAEVSVLFADISGFVELSQRLGADGVVRLFNEICREFDTLAVKHGVEKIKTIGDCYMAVAGVPEPVPDPAVRLAAMALDMQKAMAGIEARTGHRVRLRIAMATGPVLAGVIGTAKPSYDVWGPTVNLAARLESNGRPGEIHLCVATGPRLSGVFACEPLPPAELKGFGLAERYRLVADITPSAHPPAGTAA
jgi:adenylate cyclase